MIFKEDWEQCKERFNAFWDGEIIDRCCIAITAPRIKAKSSPAELEEAENIIQKWTNSEYRINQFMNYCTNTYFAGEAFPLFWNNLGPGVLAAFVGAKHIFAEDTVWFDSDPVIKDWSRISKINFNKNSCMWQTLMDLTGYAYSNSINKFIVGITDLGGNFDIAASLRGTEELLFDLYDYPEEVKSLIEQIDNIWSECYEYLLSISNKNSQGISSWMPLWCKERWYPLQCDFSAMISPSMFEEFVKPSLIRESKFLDKSIYHLDGPGEIPHLDHILDIDEITGIQWTAGAGNANEGDEKWYPMYKKIQGKGKNLVLLGIQPQCIEKLLGSLSSRGLFISTHCSSEEEVRELLKKVQKWSIE